MAQYAYLIDIVPFRWDQQAQMGLGQGVVKILEGTMLG